MIIANICFTILPYPLVFRGRGDEGSGRQSGYGSSRSEENKREAREFGDRERPGWEPRPREEPRGFEKGRSGKLEYFL